MSESSVTKFPAQKNRKQRTGYYRRQTSRKGNQKRYEIYLKLTYIVFKIQSVRFNEEKLVEERSISPRSIEPNETSRRYLQVELDTIKKWNEEFERVRSKFDQLTVLIMKGIDVGEDELELVKKRILLLKDIKRLLLKKEQLEIKGSTKILILIE